MVKKKKKKKKKNKHRSGLTAIEQRDLESQIRGKIGSGLSDSEIINKLNLQPHVYKQYVQRIYDIDNERFNRLDSVRVYTDFVERSRENIKALDGMQRRFDYRKQFTAMVAAIKQKHEIHKDVVKLGQQLGFIEQKGGEVEVETEFSFSTMTTEDVKKEVEYEIARLNKLADKNIIEMRPELLATLEDDEKRIKKYIPSNVILPEELNRKHDTRIKIRLKKRI